MRLLFAITLLLVAAAVAGCDRSQAPMLSPLSPTPSPVALVSRILTGYVSDTAYRAIAGATVSVTDGPQAGASATTDANGRFTYAVSFATPIALRASKDGYLARTEISSLAGNGATAFVYIQMEPVAPPVNIAGEYTLTLIADSACTGIPGELRTRGYPAMIADRSNPSFRPGTSLMLTADGDRFLPNYNGFPVGVAGNDVTFIVYYKQEYFAVVEQVASNAFLAFEGSATTSVGAATGSTMSASLDGIIDYCVPSADVPWSDGCTSRPFVTHEQCRSANHRLILTRR